MLGSSLLVSVLLIFAAVCLPDSHALSGTKGDIRVEVKVPSEAEVGETVDLKCEWRLPGGKKLYSVKWYKDEHEFFRYVPENSPRIQNFTLTGIYLDKQASTENSIRLTKLTLETSGQYKCEVSTEAPSFDTTFGSANLTVIAPPERSPDITGLSSQYAVGENITGNCTVWPSQPRASITWTINNERVPSENTIVYHSPPPISASKTKTILGLRLEAEVRHFDRDGGTATLRCVAKVGSREFIAESPLVMAHVNNQRLSGGDMLRGCGTDARSATNLIVVILGLVVAALHQATLLST